ncbi:agmatine deiminase family protein [Neolewinella antarctica]|uniref:Agmatine deiminase n=1 Tax=Neolewinella antarctica TaxID=442734 RepID=A0ABX0X8C0_9BACT|nr:agmatine deiminase family protein [Neolewinella antarctica]NJC25098.1 agmatine deiminase [Neolewinella antarctica]
MRLPAEWEKQQAVLFAFPRRAGDWGDQLDAASRAMIRAANLVNKVTRTIIIVSDPDHFSAYADDYEGPHVELPTDDCWVRDFGPITCETDDGETVMIDFQFNGWGGKFDATNDNQIPARLHKEMFWDHIYQHSDLELEGGSIESDGHGTILTTTTCLLNTNRNDGGLTKNKVELKLRKTLGAKRFLWLTHGSLAGDDTDAHVDTLARFVDETTIAYVACDDPADEHFADLKKMEAELQAFRTPDGKAYELLPLPWPPAIGSSEDGHRLPATYANFLISNGTIFVPTYFGETAAGHPGHTTDALVLEILKLDGRYKTVGISSRAFLEQHGSLHCLTMQIPTL